LTATLSAGATPAMDRLISRTVEKHRPLSVHFDLTYRCNERCVHCYLDHDDHGELTTAECLKVLDDLARSGTLFLTFSGGALLVTPERAARLREFDVRRVQISVYSDIPAVHDAITKVPGSLERTLAAIPILLEYGLQVKLACPLMQENLMAYRGVMALAEKLGIPYILDLTITPMMDGTSGPLAHRASVPSLLPVLRDAALHACKPQPGAPAAVTVNASPPAFGSAVSSGIESLAYEDLPCSAGHNSCYISPYGDVFPCVQLPQAAGNLRREKFDEIWYHAPQLERLRAIRESQLPICSRCEIRSYCERCPGLALMEGGDMLGAYERACALAEEKARLAGVAVPISALHRGREIASFQPAPPAECASLDTGSSSD